MAFIKLSTQGEGGRNDNTKDIGTYRPQEEIACLKRTLGYRHPKKRNFKTRKKMV